MKQGIYFTLDGIFAAFIIVGAAVLLLTYTQAEPAAQQLSTTAGDAITVLNTLTVKEIDSPYTAQVLATNLTTENDTVLRAIAILWATNNPLAENFTNATLTNFSTKYSYAVYAEGTKLYSVEKTPQSSAKTIATAKQQVSGIASGKPLSGSTATAYLRKVENKTTSSFAYLGGFVGQGNITVFLELPSDVTNTRVTALTAELDTPQPFTLKINEQYCGYFTPTAWNKTPTNWNLASCINLLQAGNNTLAFNYTNISTAYITGGYFKAAYTTDIPITQQQLTRTRYEFPGIEGVVNLYDAMLVPQTLSSMTVKLHYKALDPTVITYLTIGEKTVWASNETGDITVTLTDTNLTAAGLDYAFLSNKTVPIRVSAFNSTTTVLTGGNADIVVITDYSGSMKKDIDSESQGNSGNIANCDAIYSDTDIRRTHLARCLAKEVINITMNYTGNRLFPVYYFDNVVYNYTNPTDVNALYSHYENGMPPQGKERTCVACALSEAYDLFKRYNQTNRTRYVILLSDGLPTHCTGAGCAAKSKTYGTQVCDGYCDEAGNCNSPPAICTNSACKLAMDNSYVVAQQLKDDFNATVYTIAFGPVGTCTNATQTLQKIANITNGSYYSSQDPQQLKLIYRNISTSILERLTLVAQTVQVPQNVTASTLYNDSYIDLTHDAPVDPPANMIEVTRQTPPFGSCTPTVTIPTELLVREAHILSYSGSDWTSLVTLNNNVVFNLTSFLVPYYRLGDPYRVALPVQALQATNTLYMETAENMTATTACSNNNSLVYTALVPSVTPRTAVLENAQGCVWTIEKDDGQIQVAAIPKSYAGANTCSYTSTSISYDASDALQEAVYQILAELDFDGDGRIFISLSEENLEIIVTKISSVPYLWGPSLIEVRVWQ